MNKTKTSNLLRSIAFFLTAILLTCTFGFTVDGWTLKEAQKSNQQYDDYSSYQNTDALAKPEETPTDNNKNQFTEYINPLTGEKLTEDISHLPRLAFTFDSGAPIYGISNADILVELPTENAKSRYIAIMNGCENLWKIGSFAPSRGYISNIAKYFGATMISHGSDDKIDYNSFDLGSNYCDLSSVRDFSYTEQDKYVYSNVDLISSAIGQTSPSTSDTKFPLNFGSIDPESITTSVKAYSVSFYSSPSEEIQLLFSEGSGKYSLIRNGEILKDYLNNKMLEFTNCLILFADSTTYDNSSYNQMIMDTIGSGIGYYVSGGCAFEIKWSVTPEGSFILTTKSGDPLTVNYGRTYISFLGRSKIDYVEFL